jgi:multiple sugar transport system permease protein
MRVNVLQRLVAKLPVILLTLFAAVLAFFFIVPMVYVVISSLKPIDEIFEFPIRWIPRHVSLGNFVSPMVGKRFYLYFINSTIVAGTVTLVTIFLSSLAGYSLAKFDFRGRKALFILVLATMMLPIEVTMVPLAIITRYLGMMNTYWGLIVPVMISPFGIFWMRQFMITVPNDYADAGRIDGVHEFGIFYRLILPMSTPALGALAIFTFMSNWNSLIWPLIVASKTAIRTVSVAIVQFEGEFFSLWNEMYAMAVVSVLPTLAFFLILRGKLIRGMAMVGIKG